MNCGYPISFFLPSENGEHWCCNRCNYPIVPIVSASEEFEFDDILSVMQSTPAVITKLELSQKLAKEFLPQYTHIHIEWVCNAFRGPTDHLLTMKEVRRWAAVFVWYVAQFNGIAVNLNILLEKANTNAADFAEQFEKLVLYQKPALDQLVTTNISLQNGTTFKPDAMGIGVDILSAPTLFDDNNTNNANTADGTHGITQDDLGQYGDRPTEKVKDDNGELLLAWKDAVETGIENICKTRDDVAAERERVKMVADEHCNNIFNVDVLENRHFRASSIAAVCIYFSVREAGLKLTQKAVASGCGTSEVTLRKLQKKLIESNTMWSRKTVHRKSSASFDKNPLVHRKSSAASIHE